MLTSLYYSIDLRPYDIILTRNDHNMGADQVRSIPIKSYQFRPIPKKCLREKDDLIGIPINSDQFQSIPINLGQKKTT